VLQRQSVWKVLSDTAGDIVLNRQWRPHRGLDDPELIRHRALAPHVEDEILPEYRFHPWVEDALRLPPGKADHLMGVIALSRFYPTRGHGLEYDSVSAFFCQPIAELVLSTPTFMFCHGGRDRALEREAFDDMLPAEIAQRTGKGSINVAQLQSLAANIDFCRALILDGALMTTGWLDREKVDRLLSSAHFAHGGGLGFLHLLIAAEAWLSTWRDNAERAAA
jgi:asparagine synthase (glutamine-hydrolysing)